MRTEFVVSASGHCLQRLRERSIPDYYMDMVLRYGSRYYVPKARAYYMRWRDIPDWMPDTQAKRMHGLVVIVSEDGLALTTYRNPHFLHQVRRRPRWA